MFYLPVFYIIYGCNNVHVNIWCDNWWFFFPSMQFWLYATYSPENIVNYDRILHFHLLWEALGMRRNKLNNCFNSTSLFQFLNMFVYCIFSCDVSSSSVKDADIPEQEMSRTRYSRGLTNLRAASLWFPSGHDSRRKPCKTRMWWTLGCGWDRCLHYGTDARSHTHGQFLRLPTSETLILVRYYAI